tara:strand:- start:1591 stop:2892 length:1302 start_codon:yes stop_codon:yes gene_type:complete
MIKILKTNSGAFERQLNVILDSRKTSNSSKINLVKKILEDIKKKKDKSLIRYEKKINRISKLSKKRLFFTKKEIKKNIKKLDRKTKRSIDLAYKRILFFHKKQKFENYSFTDKLNNTFAYRAMPIDKVGIYVPGGSASYPSSVLMNSIPARVAGVKEIYMTVPCLNSKVNPGVLYAAKICGVKKIFKLGGAQAIAALAFGTETVSKVDKIVGPGNEYVALAKKNVFGEVGIDMIAGPSEVTVIADRYANPDWVASDLIAQAEHDSTSQSILITDAKKLAFEVTKSLRKQLNILPKRNIAMKSIKNFGLIILARNLKEITKISNYISPEHLQIYTKNPTKFLKHITNAGSIFLGRYSPEALGDYLAGPNHVLPTSGTAKFSSGLSVYDFLKRQSVVKISKSGIERLGPSVINLAEYENLQGHSNSVKIRLKKGS